MSDSAAGNFDDLTERLDEIIATVRSKDTSLERCLDLFDEAIEIGSRAVDMVDTFDLTPREEDALAEVQEADAAREVGAPSEPASDEAGE